MRLRMPGAARALYAGLATCALVAGAPAHAQSIIRDAEIEHMVRVYADPLFVAAGLDPDAVEIHLVNDPSLNAFVTQGQNLFLHTGIIIEAETPNELKGVIAHETGHMHNGDLVRASDGMHAAMGPMLVAMAAGILAAAAGEGGAAAGLIASSQQFGYLSFASFSRGVEATADQTGVQLLEATGQSGRGLMNFFERFRSQEVFFYSKDAEYRLDPYFRTHPLSSERIEALRARVEKQEYRDAVDSPEDIRMLARAKAKIQGFLYEPRATFTKFPETDTSTEALYARAVAHHKTGMLRDARACMDELIRREPDNPYFHELLGQILYENGRASEAVAPYRKAVELAPESALLHMGLAQALIDDGDDALLDDAMDHLQTSLMIERDNGFAWYLRARVHERRGETALAQLATAESAFASGNLPRARLFALRARDDLERGSPDWLKANDIVIAAEAIAAYDGARQRR